MGELVWQMGLGGPFGEHYQVYGSPESIDQLTEHFELIVRKNRSFRNRLSRAIVAFRGEPVPRPFELIVERQDYVNRYSNYALSALGIEEVPIRPR